MHVTNLLKLHSCKRRNYIIYWITHIYIQYLTVELPCVTLQRSPSPPPQRGPQKLSALFRTDCVCVCVCVCVVTLKCVENNFFTNPVLEDFTWQTTAKKPVPAELCHHLEHNNNYNNCIRATRHRFQNTFRELYRTRWRRVLGQSLDRALWFYPHDYWLLTW